MSAGRRRNKAAAAVNRSRRNVDPAAPVGGERWWRRRWPEPGEENLEHAAAGILLRCRGGGLALAWMQRRPCQAMWSALMYVCV